MDCVMIDRLSFERLRDQSEEYQTRIQELERENESLKNCNQLMHKLIDSLENIKFNLEKVNELMRNQYQIQDSYQPFERDSVIWDEKYCYFKCLLTHLEDEDFEECEPIDENQEFFESTVDNEMVGDQCLEECDGSDERVEVLTHCKQSLVDEWTQQESDHRIDVRNEGLSACNEEFGLNSSAINDGINSCVALNSVVNEETILKPKIRRNRKSLTPEGVMVSTIPGTKRFNCTWNGCEYATSSSGNFQKHYRIHTGEKPYKCDFSGCNYSCSDPGSIKEHKRIHSTEKAFECEWPGCQWKFSTYKLLKNHTRACHTGEKPHKCDWPGCDKSFLAPYALRTHKLKHTGDRPFKCDMNACKAAFTRSTDLLRHKRETHCTEKQFKCEYENCESKFYRKDDLRHHVKRKHECPTFGRKRKTKKNESKTGRPLRKKTKCSDESLDEPKVVIDLNVAKVNQLKKSIQINFV